MTGCLPIKEDRKDGLREVNQKEMKGRFYIKSRKCNVRGIESAYYQSYLPSTGLIHNINNINSNK